MGFGLLWHYHTINSNQIRAYLLLVSTFANTGYHCKRVTQNATKRKEGFTKLGEERVPKPPRKITGNSGSSRHAQQTQPEQQTSTKRRPAESMNPPRRETPDSSKLAFWMSKGSSHLKVIFLSSEIWGSSLPAILLYVPLISQVQRRGAACSLGHSAGFCGCPGAPRWGQNSHLPSGKAEAITSFSTLDILPARSLTACVQEQLSAWAFPVGKHMENIWFSKIRSACVPNFLDSVLSSPVYLFTRCRFNL